MSVYRKWLVELKKREDLELAEFIDCQHSRVIVAGPGSGKTRILVMKAAQLLEEGIEPPQGLACLTYSRKLARELRERLWRLGIASQANVFVGTLHGFCLYAIAQPFADVFGVRLPQPFRIASQKRSTRLFKQAKRKSNVFSWNRASFDSYRRSVYLDSRLGFGVDDSLRSQDVERLIECYERLLYFDQEEPAIDFDMLVRASLKLVMDQDFVRSILAARYPWILVDEYQDLGVALHRLVTTLVKATRMKLFAIGDPDQCIYQFQGAKPEYLLRLEEELPSMKLELTENYRSASIVACASEKILRDRHQSLKARRRGYCAVWQCKDFKHQCRITAALVKEMLANRVGGERIAILTRNRKPSRPGIGDIAGALIGVSYRMFRHPFYSNYTHLVSWLELAATWCAVGWKDGAVEFENIFQDWLDLCQCDQKVFADDEAFALRVTLYHSLSHLCSPEIRVHDWLNALEADLQMRDLLQSKLRLFRPDDFDHYMEIRELVKPGGILEDLTVDRFAVATARSGEVKINTIHGSKGSESDFIIVVGVEQLSSEDRNLLYVAMTRARVGLFLLYSGKSGYCSTLRDQLNAEAGFRFQKIVSETLPELDRGFWSCLRSSL
jgi:DNA helicase-2/ATP-dependent DNA helicase PcrA